MLVGSAQKVLPDPSVPASCAELGEMVERSGGSKGDCAAAPERKVLQPVSRKGVTFYVHCSAVDDVYALKQELIPFTGCIPFALRQQKRQLNDDEPLVAAGSSSPAELELVEEKSSLLDESFKRERENNRRVLEQNAGWAFLIRIPWLILALIGGLAAGLVIDQFEDILSEIVALTYFVPLIMDMGGNMGTQASTIYTRALLLGTINRKTLLHFFWREFQFAFISGCLFGSLGAILAYIWFGVIRDAPYATMLTLSVGVGVFMVCILGSMLGVAIPVCFNLIKVDAAAASDPVITTIKDIVGLCLYFAVAQSLLGDHLPSDLSSDASGDDLPSDHSSDY